MLRYSHPTGGGGGLSQGGMRRNVCPPRHRSKFSLLGVLTCCCMAVPYVRGQKVRGAFLIGYPSSFVGSTPHPPLSRRPLLPCHYPIEPFFISNFDETDGIPRSIAV